ncbi:MAG: hypothetical protein ACKJSK_01045 [Roseibacillus sp.]
MAGINPSYLSLIENGKQAPPEKRPPCASLRFSARTRIFFSPWEERFPRNCRPSWESAPSSSPISCAH